MTDATPTADHLIGTLSPSRIATAQRCLAQFAFRYVERLPTTSSPALQFGVAMDAVSTAAYRVKMKSGETPAAKDVADRFAAEWDFAAAAVEQWGDDDRGSLLDSGTRGAKLWRESIATHVVPLAVQEHLSATVVDPTTRDPFTLHGYLDLRRAQPGGSVVADLKTSRARFQAARLSREWQPAAYTLLAGTATFEYHVLTTTKQPEMQVLRAHVSDSDRSAFLVRAGMLRRQVVTALRSGDWLPNRTHVLCSRRYCDHWAACEARYGGKVPA